MADSDLFVFHCSKAMHMNSFWLPWVFIATHRPSLVVAGGGYSFCCMQASPAVASLVVEHRLSRHLDFGGCGTQA